MGGHGGLNILPQKRWNVYNFDNREKVKKDEQEAAKAEQLKRDQSRKRDTDLRIQQLRQARGLAPASPIAPEPVRVPPAEPESKPEPEPKSKHINLFEGIRIFDPVEVVDKRKSELGDDRKMKEIKRMKREVDKEKAKTAVPDDEKYRLGYGVAGKGVKLPWYMEKRANAGDEGHGDDEGGVETVSRSGGKKSVEELREERLKREGREKERERALLQRMGRGGVSVKNDRGYSRRR